MSVRTGEVVKLQRSSAYWVARADRHRRQGNRRRAAALLRHAVALSPQDDDLRVAYAQTLQEMECYEASNRAAFGALTLNPKRYACYGLIGHNMLALGNAQEAMDAFSRYLWAVRQAGGIVDVDYDEELDALEAAENDSSNTRARHETQLNIASRHLAMGDYDKAERSLRRAHPARQADDRYDSLRALLLQGKGDVQGSIHSAKMAVRRNPFSVRARCALAGAWCMAGKRSRGASALLKAALYCESAQDEQLYCYSAISLGFPELALCVLRRAVKQSPDRLPSVFNTAMILLKLGRMEDADPLIHRCRDLDPADVPARCTSRTLEQWRVLELTPRQVSYAAKALPLYPLLSPAESNDCLAQLAKALAGGTDAFCTQLQEDEALYNLFLYELGDPDHQLSRLIPVLAMHLPQDFAEHFMREVLVQPTPDDTAKRLAAATLMKLGAKPPYVIWHAGRIAEIDPSVQARRDGTLSRSMLIRRLANVQQQSGDTRLMTHALLLLHRMNPKLRAKVVRDTTGIFSTATEQHYRLTYGLAESDRLRFLLRYTADERRRVRKAFQLLCTLMPLPEKDIALQPPEGGYTDETDRF